MNLKKNARIALCDHCQGFFCKTWGHQFSGLAKEQMEVQRELMAKEGFNVKVYDSPLAGRWCRTCERTYSGPDTRFGQLPPFHQRKSLDTPEADYDAFAPADQD